MTVKKTDLDRFVLRWCVRAMIILMLGWSTGSVLASNLYRYENEQGIKVMTQTMPPQFVDKGYEVLNSSGRVIKVVPPALTAEELAAQSEEERQKRLSVEQKEKDKKLLSIFSHPSDAERARDRKLEALDGYIGLTRGNILKLKGDYDQLQERAAQMERGGKEVPEHLLENLSSVQRQIRQSEESIKEKEREKEVISQAYQKDIDRLQFLIDQREKVLKGQ